MRKLLLVSSSRVHGTGFLEHCRQAIGRHFQGVKTVLFVPFALANHDAYEQVVSQPFDALNIQIRSIHHESDPVAAIGSAEGLFIGGGNSFRLLKALYDRHLIEPIRRRALEAMPYMGSSAGTNMACPTIRTTNDMPIVEPPSLDALNLVPFQINPHYLDADPNSTHQGETRAQRLTEFHEENDLPVAALREGSWLEISGNEIELRGNRGMVLFQRGESPTDYAAGDDIRFLLQGDA